jgi:GNAT superfamily N-acetyltransferase
VVRPPIALEVRAIAAADVEPMLARNAAADAQRFRQALLDEAELGLVAINAGTIVGFICANLAQVDLAGLTICALPAGGAYIHNTHVLPEFRGRKVMQVLARALHLTLAERGRTFTCRLIDRANVPSLIGTERAGIAFRWAPVVKLPGMRPFFLPPAPPTLRGQRSRGRS